MEPIHVPRVTVTTEKTIPSQRTGYFRTFVVKDKNTLKDITAKMDNLAIDVNRDSLTTGCPALANLNDDKMEAVRPLMELIVKEARVKFSFPLGRTRIMGTAMVVAPAKSTRSNSWSTGQIHRDFSEVEISGVYTFYLCIDEISEDNGAILFWPESKTCQVETKNPKRNIKEMKSMTLHGPKGTIFVWDSRMLHQSLPNKTADARKALVWLVNSVSKPSSLTPPLESVSECYLRKTERRSVPSCLMMVV